MRWAWSGSLSYTRGNNKLNNLSFCLFFAQYGFYCMEWSGIVWGFGYLPLGGGGGSLIFSASIDMDMGHSELLLLVVCIILVMSSHRGELEFGKGGGRVSYSSREDWGIVGFKSRLSVRTREGNSVSIEEGCVRLGEGRIMFGVDSVWGVGGVEWGKDWWGSQGPAHIITSLSMCTLFGRGG